MKEAIHKPQSFVYRGRKYFFQLIDDPEDGKVYLLYGNEGEYIGEFKTMGDVHLHISKMN